MGTYDGKKDPFRAPRKIQELDLYAYTNMAKYWTFQLIFMDKARS